MSPLEKFGKFIVTRFRDRGLMQYHMLENKDIKTPAIQQLQESLSAFDMENSCK